MVAFSVTHGIPRPLSAFICAAIVACTGRLDKKGVVPAPSPLPFSSGVGGGYYREALIDGLVYTRNS